MSVNPIMIDLENQIKKRFIFEYLIRKGVGKHFAVLDKIMFAMDILYILFLFKNRGERKSDRKTRKKTE